uniref:Transposase IS66 n=1 Tax=Cereibacter sphaeroides (strain ATCC 17025 / ATH 2.4.3) TaxID=349102 RepID=A4X0I3_CERS5
MHGLFMALASLIHRLRRRLSFLVLLALLALNVATVSIPAVGAFVGHAVWNVLSLVPELNARKPEAPAALREARDRALRDLAQERTVLKTTQTELAAARNRLHHVEAELASRTDEVVRLGQSAEKHRRQFLLLEERVEQVAANSEESRRIITTMQKRILTMTARNSGETLTDFLPFASALVGIASLAWDAKDGCAQLSDLHDLDRLLGGGQREATLCGMDKRALKAAMLGDVREAACVEARLRTQGMQPPECEGLESAIAVYDRLGSPLTGQEDGFD